MDTILDEKSYIGVSAEEPEKLSDDSLPVDTLGSKEWKTLIKLKPKLPTEEAIRDISTSEIFIIDTIFDEISTEIEVLLFWMERHRGKSYFSSFLRMQESRFRDK